MDENDDVRAMRDELAALRKEVEGLRAEHAVAAAEPTNPTSTPRPTPVSRRQWVKGAAAAAIGGTVVALGQSERAAAGNGEFLVIGNRGAGQPGSQLATAPTQLDYTGTEDNAFVVQSGTSFSATSSTYDAVISGWTSRTVNPIGVYGFSSNSTGSAGKGVLGKADGLGAVGVEGRGTTGVRGIGSTSSTGIGVLASGRTAVRADGNLYGADVRGSRAALLLAPTTTLPPPSRGTPQVAGEVDGNTASGGAGTNELWVCTESGTPGTWRRLAGPDTAGSLVAINPFRAYDSRVAAPTPGRLSSGQNRVVSVADSRDTGNGAVVAADVVPPGATAVAYNITLDGTAATGFLSVTPGDAVSSPSSSINWSAANLILANAGLVQLDADRQIKIFCGGGGSTHFIIDITGFYL